MKKLLTLFCVLLLSASASAQVALKTNLLYDATTTPNLGLEFATAKKQTAQLFYGLNPWEYGNDKQFKHWVLQPEYRWWFCQRFNGSFVGVHAHGGQFNVGGIDLPLGIWDDLEDHRYEGWFVGGGVTYGYQWVMSRHWNFEASIGAGYAYIDYEKYACGTCGEKIKDSHKHYFGVTKAALSLVYIF